MKNTIFKTEKDIMIEKMWEIILRETKISDDAGCDWFTVGDNTFIASDDWKVSSDREVANLVNSINSLNGYTHLINASSNEAKHAPYNSRLKYFEIKEPLYALIKAKNKDEAKRIFVEDVCGELIGSREGIEVVEEMSGFREISRDSCLVIFSQALAVHFEEETVDQIVDYLNSEEEKDKVLWMFLKNQPK